MPGERTEKATPKRRRDERKKGNVLQSKDIVTVFTLIGGFYALKLTFLSSYSALKGCMLKYFSFMQNKTELTQDLVREIAFDSTLVAVRIIAPLMACIVILSIAATVFQTKPLFVLDSLKPKFNRLSPLQGFKKIFSVRSIVEVLKGIIKISILFYLLYSFIEKQITELPKLFTLEIPAACAYIFQTVFDMALRIGLAFAVISVFDYFYQRWEYERQLKMSKQEIKEEYKQLEGDPQIKGKIKEMQRKMAMSRMMQQVPDADVVIRNPTHFAVALRYDPEKHDAPVLLAKGQDEMALRIVRVAEENEIYVIENKPLARAIYASTDLNQQLPPEFYGAVAEILVHVYRISNKL